MAEFIIRVLKWLAALVVAYFLLFVLVILVLVGIGVALEPAPEGVEPDSVLVLDLGFNLTDQPNTDDASLILRNALAGELLPSASLRQVLDGLDQARQDPDISGLLITGTLLSDGYGGSFAALSELRQAIAAFGSDKPVWAYLDGDSLRDYYLKSAATEIISDPHAALDFRGLRAERLYLGDAFERIGIEVQVEAFEEFKTAAETFQQSAMSEPERQQLQALIDDLWSSLAADIAASRGMEPSRLNAIAAKELILYGNELPERGLADRTMNEDELIAYLAEQAGMDDAGDTFRQYDFLDYADLMDPQADAFSILDSGNKVAVVYVEGIIVDGEGEDGTIGSATLNDYLRELRNDDSVKAVVLRINSPGGSATASAKVVREIELTNAEKPVVVSMGGVAASGGYMLAAAGARIFTEPSTITGSIGVVIMLPNIEGLAQKLSVNFEGVETHPFAGTYSLARAKTPEELRQIRALAADFYGEFLQLVAVNRELTLERTRELARGRVWSGGAAVANGLADELGGLMAAVQRAADLAGIGDDYTLIERPEPLTLEQKIEKWLVGAGMARASAPKGLQSLVRDLQVELERLATLNDPRGQYAILPYTLRIQ